MAVGMRHQFIGFFGGSIQAYRVVKVLMLIKRQVGITAVNARAARIDQMFHALVPAGLQHVHKALNVGVNIGMRIG